QQAAYVMAGEVGLGAGRGGSAAKAMGKGSLPAWSGGSGRVAFYSNQAGSEQLWVSGTRGGRATQITNCAGGINADPRTRQSGSVSDIVRVSWSPDGTKLVFASRVESARKPAGSAQTWQPADAASGRPLVLTNDTPAAWTLNGVFTSAFGKPAAVAAD